MLNEAPPTSSGSISRTEPGCLSHLRRVDDEEVGRGESADLGGRVLGCGPSDHGVDAGEREPREPLRNANSGRIVRTKVGADAEDDDASRQSGALSRWAAGLQGFRQVLQEACARHDRRP